MKKSAIKIKETIGTAFNTSTVGASRSRSVRYLVANQAIITARKIARRTLITILWAEVKTESQLSPD
mgnify:CR=1 FL=1